MKTVLIDNYDSFTYNLYHLLRQFDIDITVFRNDTFQMNELESFDKILLSPGPGIPKESGLLMDVIQTYAGKKPILGICLGEQAIGESFGGTLVNLPDVFHGVQTPIDIVCDDYLFNNIDKEIPVGRYHSWVVDRDSLPSDLEVLALSKEGYIMALRHKTYDVRGIQFHPESVLTPDGEMIMKNWILK